MLIAQISNEGRHGNKAVMRKKNYDLNFICWTARPGMADYFLFSFFSDVTYEERDFCLILEKNLKHKVPAILKYIQGTNSRDFC